MCSLGVLTYSSVSITLSGITMVITTSPFQVLFHLAETSMPTMGGGVVSVVLDEVYLAIVTEMTKQIHIY